MKKYKVNYTIKSEGSVVKNNSYLVAAEDDEVARDLTIKYLCDVRDIFDFELGDVEYLGEVDREKGVIKNSSNKSSKIFLWIIIGLISIPIILFGYGYFTAAADVDKGINMFGIAFRIERMNPISVEGYGMYMRNNTDFLERYNDIWGDN